MSSQIERRVFEVWRLARRVERRGPEKVFVKIRESKEVIYGEVYEYEPCFRNDEIEFYAYLPARSRSCINEVHDKLVRLGYAVDGFGEYGNEVIVHYRRGEEGIRVYRLWVDDRYPRYGWRVSSAYVVASSEDETKSLMDKGAPALREPYGGYASGYRLYSQVRELATPFECTVFGKELKGLLPIFWSVQRNARGKSLMC